MKADTERGRPRLWNTWFTALAGLFVFGAIYEPLREFLGHDGLLLAATAGYLLVLRVLANVVDRWANGEVNR
jgi:hypothetical protein